MPSTRSFPNGKGTYPLEQLIALRWIASCVQEYGRS
jgi:hypothetical protein